MIKKILIRGLNNLIEDIFCPYSSKEPAYLLSIAEIKFCAPKAHRF